VLMEISKMEQRYDAVVAVMRDGFTVTEEAQKFGVSRQSLYRWMARYEESGLEELAEGSHRPKSVPPSDGLRDRDPSARAATQASPVGTAAHPTPAEATGRRLPAFAHGHLSGPGATRDDRAGRGFAKIVLRDRHDVGCDSARYMSVGKIFRQEFTKR
jgi:transposase-like protein